MVEDQHQVIGIAIAMRSLADCPDARVVAFEGGVGQPVTRPRVSRSAIFDGKQAQVEHALRRE